MRSTDDEIIGCFAFSKAGHDKGRLYIITGLSGDIVFLSDGRLKPVGSPKKKKLKHIQIVKKRCTDTDTFADTDIKRAIKLFLKEGKEAD